NQIPITMHCFHHDGDHVTSVRGRPMAKLQLPSMSTPAASARGLRAHYAAVAGRLGRRAPATAKPAQSTAGLVAAARADNQIAQSRARRAERLYDDGVSAADIAAAILARASDQRVATEATNVDHDHHDHAA